MNAGIPASFFTARSQHRRVAAVGARKAGIEQLLLYVFVLAQFAADNVLHDCSLFVVPVRSLLVTVIAHKVGYLYGYAHDAGVIYGTKKNVLVVLLTGEWKDSTTQAPPVFAKLSSELWTWMEQ